EAATDQVDRTLIGRAGHRRVGSTDRNILEPGPHDVAGDGDRTSGASTCARAGQVRELHDVETRRAGRVVEVDLLVDGTELERRAAVHEVGAAIAAVGARRANDERADAGGVAVDVADALDRGTEGSAGILA